MSTIDSLGTTGLLNSIQSGSKTHETQSTSKYGNTVGNPELSDSAAEYYDSLKKKYSNLEFVLVDNDSVDTAEQQASKYAGKGKTVVLIDAAKIEKMASDETYRSQYESIIENGAKQIEELGNKLASTGANVKGYGMRINDNGTATYFAVLEKSMQAQNERIAKAQAAKKEAKAEANKKAQKERQKELYEKRTSDSYIRNDYESDDDVKPIDIINASSMEELLDKLADYEQNNRLNMAKTYEELQLGQSIDFSL